MIKHATAGIFVFSKHPDDTWKLGLVKHPRLEFWVIPGGHVEPDENQVNAAFRETFEETGLSFVRLVSPPTAPFPEEFPFNVRQIAMPWWITEVNVGKDNQLNEPHIHIDHQYVGVAWDIEPVAKGAHPFGWYAQNELPAERMFIDTQLLASCLFANIESLSEERQTI